MRSFTLSMDESRRLSIKVEGDTLDSVSLNDPSASKTSTILAYRPKYADYHSSNLAAIFVNIKKVFPCTEGIQTMNQCAMHSPGKKMDSGREKHSLRLGTSETI